MVPVRITSGQVGHGTRIWVNDQELQGVRDASIHFGVDEANRLSLELIAGPVEMSFEARVEPTFFTLPGFRIVQETRADGTVVVRTEAEEGTTPESAVAAVHEFLAGHRALRVRGV